MASTSAVTRILGRHLQASERAGVRTILFIHSLGTTCGIHGPHTTLCDALTRPRQGGRLSSLFENRRGTHPGPTVCNEPRWSQLSVEQVDEENDEDKDNSNNNNNNHYWQAQDVTSRVCLSTPTA
jgi:hypothetical protein